jgi:hypothetical protein
MSDEIMRALERQDWRLAIRPRARAGAPFDCIFCGHALTGETRCAHREEWQVGRALFVDRQGALQDPDGHWSSSATFVGHYAGNGEMTVRQDGAATVSILKIPESWRPPACGCDHADVPEQRTMREYQDAHGVDVRVVRAAHLGILYHTENRNRDGTPQRWRTNGGARFWKRDPQRFRMPLKHGMYDYGELVPSNCHMFRTMEAWALNDYERSKRNER